MAGDHGVLDERVPGGNQPDARRADVHPGARRKLEVFGDASVESEAQLGLLRIGEFQRVADAVVAFLVERGPREVVASIVAGCDVGAFHARFELAPGGNELDLAAGHRQPDDAGAVDRIVHARRHRRRFRRTPRRNERDPAPELGERELLHALPEVLRQRCACVDHEVELTKEVRAQLGVLLEEG